jgi:hypothetical protein
MGRWNNSLLLMINEYGQEIKNDQTPADRLEHIGHLFAIASSVEAKCLFFNRHPELRRIGMASDLEVLARYSNVRHDSVTPQEDQRYADAWREIYDHFIHILETSKENLELFIREIQAGIYNIN